MAADASKLPLIGRADRLLRDRPKRPNRSLLWLIFPLAFGVRLIYDASRQLVPDEAFYWLLSRHLATGYLDHPPMVAYVIRAGTFVFGSNELGVRSMMSVLGFASILILMGICRRLLRDDRAVFWLGLSCICSPLMTALSTLATPDTPAIFFSVCAMAVVIPAVQEQQTVGRRLLLWLAFGFCTGAALVSKYTSVLPALAVAMALLTTAVGRRQLRTVGPWLAVLVALAVFSPVFHWNAHHHWASFKFQLHHGLDVEEQRSHLKGLGELILGQFGFFTPVLMLVGLVVTAKNWIAYPRLDLAMRILLWSATVPLIFFAIAAFKSGGSEANWPAFAYFPMSILIVEDLHQNWQRSGVMWVRIGIGLSFLISITLQSPEAIYKIAGPRPFLHKLDDFFGWKELAMSVQRERYDAMVVADRHQDAGELAFYLTGQPDVWCYPLHNKKGEPLSRATSFDYMDDRPNLAQVENVVFVGGDAKEFCREYGFVPYDFGSWSMRLHSDKLRDRSIVACSRKMIIKIPLLGPTTGMNPSTTQPISDRHDRVLRRISSTEPADTKTAP
jgi:hypothetical protein